MTSSVLCNFYAHNLSCYTLLQPHTWQSGFPQAFWLQHCGLVQRHIRRLVTKFSGVRALVHAPDPAFRTVTFAVCPRLRPRTQADRHIFPLKDVRPFLWPTIGRGSGYQPPFPQNRRDNLRCFRSSDRMFSMVYCDGPNR